MSTDTTPVCLDKKRGAVSPLDQADTKKSRILSDGDETVPVIQMSEEQIIQIGNILKVSFDQQISDMVSNIVSGVLQGLENKVANLEQENAQLREQVTSLTNKVTVLENKVESLASDNEKSGQYSRRNCLRVTGLKEGDGEAVDQVVMDMIKAIGADVSLDDIDRTHRLGKTRNSTSSTRSRDVIVKFVSYRSRQKVYKLRTKLKDVGYRNVFINEELTKQRSELFSQARKWYKSKLVHGTWTYDGVIFVKDNAQFVHRLSSVADFEKFKLLKGLP